MLTLPTSADRSMLSRQATRQFGVGASLSCICLGDSITANSGPNSVSSPTYLMGSQLSNGIFGAAMACMNNLLVYPEYWNFGVGSCSSLSLLNRLNSTRIDNGTSGGANPAFAVTALAGDKAWNISSDGSNSPLSCPAQVAIINVGTNDPGATNQTALSSMQNIASILDQLAASGKELIGLCNLLPRGVAYAALEIHAVATGVTTITMTNAATFLADASVNGDIGVQDAAGNVFTKVASAPAAGQYSVNNATGVYTISAADATTYNGASLYFSYTYSANSRTGSGLTWHKDLSLWCGSSAPVFTSSFSGTTYPISGALYGRPKVVPLNIWDQIADPATVGTTELNAPLTLADGLHPMPGSAVKVGKYIATKMLAALGYLGRNDKLSAYNNWKVATANGAQTTFTGTAPGKMKGISAPSTGVTIRAGSIVGTDSGTGTITGSGISGTYNYSSGALSVTFTTPPVVNTIVVMNLDDTNLLRNGNCEYAQGNGSANPANVSGTVPLEWSVSVDSPSATALASGAMTLSTAQDSGPGGIGDGIVFNIAKLCGTNNAQILLQQQLTSLGALNRLVAGQLVYAAGVIKIEAGANGHLSGLCDAHVQVNVTSSAAVTRAGVATITSITSKGVGGSVGSQLSLNDHDLANGPILLPMMSAPFSMAGMAINFALFNLQIKFDANRPISCKITVGQLKLAVFGGP